MKKTRRIIFIFCAGYVALTLYSLPETKGHTDEMHDFMNIHKPPQVVANLIQTGCYDCHSNRTRYPFYAYFPPISNWIQGHIQHGKGKLNLSDWGKYNALERAELLALMVEEIKRAEMPPPNYLLMHEEANWDSTEKEAIYRFIEEISNKD